MIFNINEYPGDYVMHCVTEEEALSFCEYLHSVGRRWNGGESYINKSNFGQYKDGILYCFNKGTHCNLAYAIMEGYKILEWSMFMYSLDEAIKTLKLSEVPQDSLFKIGDHQFKKLADVDDTTVIITTEKVFDSPFGDNNNFGQSLILSKLISDVLPQIEELVGAENVLEFETDLQAYDDRNKYMNIQTKISIPTHADYDYYNLRYKIFNSFWICTAYQNSVLRHIPSAMISQALIHDTYGVNPILHLKSSVEVSVNY